jgi:hypothetical protein
MSSHPSYRERYLELAGIYHSRRERKRERQGGREGDTERGKGNGTARPSWIWNIDERAHCQK